MDISRRPLIKSIGGTAAALSIAGCIGSDDEDDDSFRMWTDFTDAEEDDIDSFISDFEAETDHTVDREDVAELEDQIETAMPAGDGPETWAWAHDWVGRFASRDDPEYLYDASDDLNIDTSIYTEVAQDAIEFEGGIYGLPFGSETVTLFYNEDLVDQPPETLDEMIETMEEFYNPADAEYGLSYPATDPYFASGFLQATGGLLYDDETNEVGVDGPEVVDALEMMEENIFSFIPEDPDYGPQVTPFVDGNAPFAINGPWELGNFQSELDNVGVAELPTVDGNHPRTFAGIQVWYFSAEMAEDEEAREATVDWAEWYTTNQEVTQANVSNHGLGPVHSEHAEEIDTTPEMEAFGTQVGHGIPTPLHPDMDSVWEPTADALTEVFNGEETAQAALENAAQRIRDNI